MAINPFTFDKEKGTITGYDVSIGGTDVVIPKQIDGVDVVTIGNDAFSNKKLTSVKIPNSVTVIGNDAFVYNRLTYVEIPNSVTSIANAAFAGNKLTSVEIPNSVIYMGYGAFAANQLTSVTIGGRDSYRFNLVWSKIGFPVKLMKVNPYIFDRYTGTITGYDMSIGGTDVVIPKQLYEVDVVAIGDEAFINNKLTSVVIPDSVTSIGDSAFWGNRLTSVEIPDSVTSIGNSAFGLNELTSVKIPNSVTAIGDATFYENKLTSVKIPSSVTTIGEGAFVYNRLTYVEIPNSVTSIGGIAFAGSQLTSVKIPNSVTSIGLSAFAGSQVTSVTIEGKNPYRFNSVWDGIGFPTKLMKVNPYTFDRDTGTITGYDVSIGGTDVVIPKQLDEVDVVAIGDEVFRYKQLTSVVIPDSVTSIGDDAFNGNKLTSVTIEGKYPYRFNSRWGEIGFPIKVIAANTDYSAKNSNIKVGLIYLGNESGIKQKQCKVTNSTSTPTSWNNYTGQITLSTNGNHYVHYRAVDDAGNIKTGHFGPYIIDKVAPTVTADNTDYSVKNSHIRVGLTYADNKSGIKQKQHKVTNSTATPNSWENYSGEIILAENGTHYIHFKVVDNAGNVKIGYFGPYKIDITSSDKIDLAISSITTDKKLPFTIDEKVNFNIKVKNFSNVDSPRSLVVLKDSNNNVLNCIKLSAIKSGSSREVVLNKEIKIEDIVDGQLKINFAIECIDNEYTETDSKNNEKVLEYSVAE
ncbi:MAG: leucine-rich repeat domain-containing protein [Anaeromicrobium sp.]|jgi:hypothetical protein|uniref:leucine-rich repeat domain-containing protein n=1 Tax=Anaeromicrobium sp. TaxID=1929132 RepID=UPI0025EDB88B|nr:leucine-rich repeat domain-containing protein [Anaeromicrobium sp.]MCT4593629.1 leucine-rich repeat domain-containing protein [Anaeromicrobium sp.]